MSARKSLVVAIAAAIAMLPATALAQEPGRVIVSTWHAAPGQQVALLKWLADQDRAAAAAGVAKSQIYAHTEGAEWDYLVIQPETTPAQDAAVEAAGKKLGIDTGPHSALDFRKYIATHTDTIARGPMTAAEYLAYVGEK